MSARLHRIGVGAACVTFAAAASACELAFPTHAESDAESADANPHEAASDAASDEGADVITDSTSGVDVPTDAADAGPEAAADATDGPADSCSAAPDAADSISLVNFLTATGGSDGGAMSSPLAVTAGDLLVVEAHWGVGGATVVSDALGNTWTPASLHQNTTCGTSGQFDQFWYVVGSKGGSDVVSVAFPPGEGGAFGFFVMDYSGIAQSGAFDSESGQVGSANAANMSTGMLTTTPCGRDLIVSAFDWWGTGTFTAGSGFTSEGVWMGYSAIEDDLPGGAAPGTYDPTGSLTPSNTCWIGASVAFRAR